MGGVFREQGAARWDTRVRGRAWHVCAAVRRQGRRKSEGSGTTLPTAPCPRDSYGCGSPLVALELPEGRVLCSALCITDILEVFDS